MTAFDHLNIQLWKNWILAKRSCCRTAKNIYLPLILIGVVLFLQLGSEIIYYKEQHHEAFNLPSTASFYSTLIKIVYTPANPHLNRVLRKITQNVQSCKNEKELIQQYRKIREAGSYLFVSAFQFEKRFNNQNENDFMNLKIKIRMPSDDNHTLVHWNLDKTINDKVVKSTIIDGSSPETTTLYNYDKYAFLINQNIIAHAFMSEKNPTPNLPDVYIQIYPYPKHIAHTFYDGYLLHVIILIFLFSSNFAHLVSMIVTEKELQLFALMKIMGLKKWVYMIANFICYFIMFFIGAIVVVTLLSFLIFPHSDWSLLLMFFLIYGSALGCFSFFLAALFSKAQTATFACQWINVLNLVIYILIAGFELSFSQLSIYAKILLTLLPSVGFAFGLHLYFSYESHNIGIKWHDIFQKNGNKNNVRLGYLLLMFIFDCFLYVFLAYYINEIKPGEFGVAKKWYYFLTKEYWAPSAPQIYVEQKSNKKISESFEEELENLPVGVKLTNLKKMFGDFTSVDNLNLNMYKGHITVLLGHNGAGKTTTIAMITGLFSPTSGTVIVNGYDIRTNLPEVQKTIGVCFQHNVLLEKMTVEEHLEFFCKLKGLKRNEVDDEVDLYLEVLNLENKRKTFSMNLSGGMKRRLCIGMSLCGNSQVVLLDEPTAGVDPTARRDIWTLLQEQKHNRTMLLTTHFMEEADLLADRIAIMASGRLICVGSSFFLKKKFGTGYSLVIDTTPNCNPDEVTNILREHISNLQIKSIIGLELTYLLKDKDSQNFETMFADLENNMDELGVKSFGVSLTTLEEIFLKVGTDHMKANKDAASNKLQNKLVVNLLVGKNLLVNQFRATVWKIWIMQYRSWFTLLLKLLLPVISVTVSYLLEFSYIDKTKRLALNLQNYEDTITLFKGPSNWLNNYKSSLKGFRVDLVPNIETYLLKKIKKNPIAEKYIYVIGAEFNKQNVTAWFNKEAYHSKAISLAMVLNSFYKEVFGKSATLEFEHVPMPPSSEAIASMNAYIKEQAGGTLSIITFVYLVTTPLYIILTVKERISKAKHLQIIFGLNMFLYWFATFLCDYSIYLFSILLVLIVLGILKFTSDVCAIFVLLLLFGFIILQLAYICSFVSSSTAKGISLLYGIGITSIFVNLTLQVFSMLNKNNSTKDKIKQASQFLLVFPFFSLRQGLHNIEKMLKLNITCSNLTREQSCNKTYLKQMCCNFDHNVYSTKTHGIGLNIIIALVSGIIIFIFLVLIDQGMLKLNLPTKKKFKKIKNLDNDVLEENNRIYNSDPSSLQKMNNIVVLKNLSKYYGKFLAVNQLYLGLHPYECFGLLGVNGAGKTTTFKMMTGDESISNGDVFINGISLKKNLRKVQKHVGYCPQFDALLDNLTVRETIRFFAMIRGVPSIDCKNIIEHLSNEFDFSNHLHKKIKQLSGGNKRKLSTAIATIGNPPVIYLDEPSTGMDPATKRHLWNGLCNLRDRGSCIILTSHSMEECEALCTRVAIMVAGEFKCLGSIQHLKNKFTPGYALNIKLKKHMIVHPDKMKKEIDAVKNFVKKNFPDSVLKEDHTILLSFGLMNTNNMPLSQIFGILERAKYEYNLEDYSLSQCSLEQVFLVFTSKPTSV